jgi:hypothetical protein
MSRARKQLLVPFAVVATIVVTLILAGTSMQRSLFYPEPRALPAVVSQTTEQLLVRLQSVLETNAPIVARALQPGFSDAQIVALEAQGGFHLSEDLRALYRWHKASAPTALSAFWRGRGLCRLMSLFATGHSLHSKLHLGREFSGQLFPFLRDTGWAESRCWMTAQAMDISTTLSEATPRARFSVTSRR